MVWGVLLVAALITVAWFFYSRRNRQPTGKSSARAGSPVQHFREEMESKPAKRDEALFASMFPDLQPYFHPEALVQFVRAARSRVKPGAAQGPFSWKRAPGFNVPLVEIHPGAERVLHELKDEAGKLLASFHYDTIPEGGVLRVGKGKFTVNVKEKDPRVRYWHPEREFKWSRNKWLFVTPLAAAAFAANADDDRRSWNDDRSSASASDAGSAESFSGRGGSFDGGGASGGWEESASSSSGSSSDSSSVESGSSSSPGSDSSSSTGY